MSVKGADPHSQVVDALREGRPIEAQYVRQGRRSMRIVWVLAISLALAALATFAMWAFRAPEATNVGPAHAAAAGQTYAEPYPSAMAKQRVSQDPTAAQRGSTSTNNGPAR